MTCYSTTIVFSSKQEMDRFMDWVDENQTLFPIIRAKAWEAWPIDNSSQDQLPWIARIVLQTKDDVRRLHRQWPPEVPDDYVIKPW